jgi:hypothetical protein
LAATSGVKVLIARPLSTTTNRMGRISLAAALRHSAIRPFCAPPSPTNTMVMRSSSRYLSGSVWRSSKIDLAAPVAYGNCSDTSAQPPWKFFSMS